MNLDDVIFIKKVKNNSKPVNFRINGLRLYHTANVTISQKSAYYIKENAKFYVRQFVE